MMATPIILSTTIVASPERIFDALTMSAGLTSFWTNDSRAEPVVGSVARFRFPSGSRLAARVDELKHGRRVVWSPLTDPPGGPHWTGTTVNWELTQMNGGATEVLVEQGAWPDDLPQSALWGLVRTWVQVLLALKGYVETGTPQPYFAGEARWPAVW
jgi:uncharacterized protein YndB with AHSA1/START domain